MSVSVTYCWVKPTSKFSTLKWYTFIIAHKFMGWLGGSCGLGWGHWEHICDHLFGCSWGLAGLRGRQLGPWDFLHVVSSSAAGCPKFLTVVNGPRERVEVHEAPWGQGSELTQPNFCQNKSQDWPRISWGYRLHLLLKGAVRSYCKGCGELKKERNGAISTINPLVSQGGEV